MLFSYKLAAGWRREALISAQNHQQKQRSVARVGAATLCPHSCKPSTAPVGDGCGDGGTGNTGEGTGFGFQSYLETGISPFASEIRLEV